jgi:hypothetical protein
MFGAALEFEIDDVEAVRSGYPLRRRANLIHIQSHFADWSRLNIAQIKSGLSPTHFSGQNVTHNRTNSSALILRFWRDPFKWAVRYGILWAIQL